MRSSRLAQITIAAALALLLAAPAQAVAARPAPPLQAECQHILDLYRACHRLGTQADSVQTCQEAALDHAARAEARAASKNVQAIRALTELVCSTGCEDGVSGQPPATAQEFTEAFCDPTPTTKSPGGRP